jgi:hypothetical protein
LDTSSWTFLQSVVAGTVNSTDVNPGAGTHAYLIKAVGLKTTGSGSYYNLSQGTAALAQ